MSKLWDKVKEACSSAVFWVKELFGELGERSETADGKYSMVSCAQIVLLVVIGLVTFAFGFTPAIYGACVVLALLINTNQLDSDAITYYYKDKNKDAKNEDGDVSKDVEPAKLVLFLGLLHVAVCIVFGIVVHGYSSFIGFLAILAGAAVVLLDLYRVKLAEKYADTDEFKELLKKVSNNE